MILELAMVESAKNANVYGDRMAFEVWVCVSIVVKKGKQFHKMEQKVARTGCARPHKHTRHARSDSTWIEYMWRSAGGGRMDN